jgi:hypothetical protein
MKSLSVKMGVVLIGLIIFGYPEVWGADWEVYARQDNFTSSYDAGGITTPFKNIVRVRIKNEFTEKGVAEAVRRFGKKYENINYSIALKEINCSNKKGSNLFLTYYSKEGKPMFTYSSDSEWNPIVPESVGEALYKAVCK